MSRFFLKHWLLFSAITVPIGYAIGYPPEALIAGIISSGFVMVWQLR